MPKQQSGSVVRRGSRNYGVRYYDETGTRRYQGGFETISAAEAWLRDKVDGVLALRRGDLPTPDTLPTVETLIDSFLASHDVDPATTDKLRYELAHAKRAFGTRHRRVEAARALGLASHAPAPNPSSAVRLVQAGA